MWPGQLLADLKLPKTWGLYQAIHVVDGSTFEMYLKNMQSMFIDMVSNADMVLFNRCTQDMPLSGWKRSVRAVNRMCEIVFEDDRGEELEVEDILPYSLEQSHITLEDADYGIWYLDIQEHPDRYVGKTITYKAQAMTGMRLPRGTFVPGRNAMTCCAEDIRFFGFLCKYDKARSCARGSGSQSPRRFNGNMPTSMRTRGCPLRPERGKGPGPGGSAGLFPISKSAA